MPRELVPELHDIGKLVDNKAIRELSRHFENHSFAYDLSRFGLPEPATLTWLAIRHHMQIDMTASLGALPGRIKAVPLDTEDGRLERKSLLNLCLADRLAASTSRVVREPAGRVALDTDAWRPQRQVLWRTAKEVVGAEMWSSVRSRDALADLLTLLSEGRSWTVFAEKYGDDLDAVAEDRGFPRNLTTLRTHLELTGKYFRMLERHTTVRRQPLHLVYNRESVGHLNDAWARWQFRLVRCQISFPQKPARTHDLGVFIELDKVLTDMMKKDHVLLKTLDSLLLFLPAEESFSLRDAVAPLLDSGFVVQASIVKASLNDLSSGAFRRQVERVRPIALYPSLAEQIEPPICDLCQIRQGHRCVDRDSGIVEMLCESCSRLRRLSSEKNRFTKLGGLWEQKNLPVAWVRLRLDYERLGKALKRLYERYLRGGPDTTRASVDGEDINDTGLVVDFTKDFFLLSRRFMEQISECFGDNVERISGENPELLAVALQREGDALRIADAFCQEIRHLFPDCVEDSPVVASVSIANAKYPFFEHWQYLDKPKEAVNIQAVGRAHLELSVTQFRRLRELKPEKASSKLHRAVALGVRTRSELMEKIAFLEDLRDYPELHQAHIEGFSVSQLLNYHMLLDIGGQS